MCGYPVSFVGCEFNGTTPTAYTGPETAAAAAAAERLGRRRAAETPSGSAARPAPTTTHAAGQGTWEIGSLGTQQQDPHQQEQKKCQSRRRRGHESRIAAPQLQEKVRAIAPCPWPLRRCRPWIRAPGVSVYLDPPGSARRRARLSAGIIAKDASGFLEFPTRHFFGVTDGSCSCSSLLFFWSFISTLSLSSSRVCQHFSPTA